ncbi:MAG: SAM-dependent methyltransferase [Defluviitaleaceae bacterium]|nr:SAM-dependent methyltransferase [Defluviitaleaceae bacterium]
MKKDKMINIKLPILPDTMFSGDIYKVVLSSPSPSPAGEPKAYTRAEAKRNGDKFQLSMYTKKQVFHSNFVASELRTVIGELLGVKFQQYHAWDTTYEYSAKVSKKGKILTSRKKATSQPRAENFTTASFDRQKNHIIKEGENIPALTDMGVFTKDGKIATGMRDKFNQINRFLELLADETGPKAIAEGKVVNIVDFGCGKSYLTFLVYHYFTNMRKLKTNICGMDMDASVVQTCTASASKYGYKHLNFIQGDIGNQVIPPIEGWGQANTFNIVISLHACDTATDHTLYNAIKWKADLIYAVPCCQHELRQQMQPKSLPILSRYGIIKERVAALTTDAIRANLLECCGYKAQIIEFVDMEHTPKNLLIRAKRRIKNNNTAVWGEIERIIDEFSYEPTLLTLLKEGKCLPAQF